MYKFIDEGLTDYNYHTAPVNGDDIFDTSTLGGFSFLAQAIPGSRDAEYMKTVKNRIGEIVQMSPAEYYKICADRFHTDVETLKQQRSADHKYLEELKEVITEKKVKFPMPFIDYTSEGSQEGLHRMLAAAELFGWDHKFPVLIINWFDKAKHEKQVKEEHDLEIYHNIEEAIRQCEHYSFTSLEDFRDQLQAELDKQFWVDWWKHNDSVDFKLTLDGPNSIVQVDDVAVKFDMNDISIDEFVEVDLSEKLQESTSRERYQLVGTNSYGYMTTHVEFDSFEEAYAAAQRLINNPDPKSFSILYLTDYNTKRTQCIWELISSDPEHPQWQFSDIEGRFWPKSKLDLSEGFKHMKGSDFGWIRDPMFSSEDFTMDFYTDDEYNPKLIAKAHEWNALMREAQNLEDQDLIKWAEKVNEKLNEIKTYYVHDEIKEEVIDPILNNAYVNLDLSEATTKSYEGNYYISFQMPGEIELYYTGRNIKHRNLKKPYDKDHWSIDPADAFIYTLGTGNVDDTIFAVNTLSKAREDFSKTRDLETLGLTENDFYRYIQYHELMSAIDLSEDKDK